MGSVTRVKKITRNVNIIVNIVVFTFYYTVSLLSIRKNLSTNVDDSQIKLYSNSGGEGTREAKLYNALLFPISYLGIGMKFARFGLEDKGTNISALEVFWSGKLLAEKVIDCVEA